MRCSLTLKCYLDIVSDKATPPHPHPTPHSMVIFLSDIWLNQISYIWYNSWYCESRQTSKYRKETENSPYVSVQHGAGVERGKSATVGGLLGGVQLERLGRTAWNRWRKIRKTFMLWPPNTANWKFAQWPESLTQILYMTEDPQVIHLKTKNDSIMWGWRHMEAEMASMAQFQLAALIHRSSRAHQSCFIKTQNNNMMRRTRSVHRALREQKLLSSVYKHQISTIRFQFTPT